ncbi:MAG: response regulator [Synechococcales bacterium]|nr:response regulator [Synechococcales bacterium]
MTRHVLIIDDEPDIRRVVQVSLEKFARWRTTLAASGQAGLEKARAETPDAILLDVSMPDMDGVTCFNQLQADPATRPIPVVLLTAKVLPSDRQRFAEMGVAGVVTKPFDPLTIWREVAEILHWNQD